MIANTMVLSGSTVQSPKTFKIIEVLRPKDGKKIEAAGRTTPFISREIYIDRDGFERSEARSISPQPCCCCSLQIEP